MTSAAPATELLPLPTVGRRFSAERTVRLGDVDANGELRLDAVARYLQDVASDDALDAGLPNAMGWLVRRTMIDVGDPSHLNETVTATTYCTGYGRSWAERRTSMVSSGGGRVEAVSLWVQIDVERGRPARLGPEFHERYGEAAGGRTVSSKLQLPGPSTDGDGEGDGEGEGDGRAWAFRATDLDPFAHVNNAAQWAMVESALDGRPRRGTFELEYLVPVDLGVLRLIVADANAWLLVDDRVLSAAAWSLRPG